MRKNSFIIGIVVLLVIIIAWSGLYFTQKQAAVSDERDGIESMEEIQINVKKEIDKEKFSIENIPEYIKEEELLGVSMNKNDSLRLHKQFKDDLGFQHFRYQQLYKGIEVYGGEIIVHINDKGDIYLINGKYHNGIERIEVQKEEFIDRGDIIKNIKKTLKGECSDPDITEEKLVIYKKDGYKLSFQMEVSCGGNINEYTVIADVYSGEIYNYYSKIMTK